MGLEKREARSHRAHRPATPRSSFRDRRTGTPPAPRDTGKGPLILRGPETRLHPPRLRLIPGQPPKIYFRLSILQRPSGNPLLAFSVHEQIMPQNGMNSPVL